MLAALNKTENSVAAIVPASIKVTADVVTGEGTHEGVPSADGKPAHVANYGNQQPGSSISVIVVAAGKGV